MEAEKVYIQTWYPGKASLSFTDALSCLRRMLWRDRIKFIFGNNAVHDKDSESLIEALASTA